MEFGFNGFKQNIREWYMGMYPSDELGSEINGGATFKGLFDALDCYKDVYEYIGVGDSIIRERCFERLAALIGKPYMYVYDQWMLAAKR